MGSNCLSNAANHSSMVSRYLLVYLLGLYLDHVALWTRGSLEGPEFGGNISFDAN